MGIIGSRLGGYSQVVMMNTEAHINFKDELQREWTTAQAVGRMETIQQAQIAGGGGGSAGAASGVAGLPWYTIGSMMYSFSAPAVIIGGIAALMVYMLGGSQAAMFASLFLAFMFFMNGVLWITASQRGGILTGRNFMASFFGGMIASALISFMLYDPDGSDKSNTVVITPASATGAQVNGVNGNLQPQPYF